MEIQNTQIGQTFALKTQAAPVQASPLPAAEASSDGSSQTSDKQRTTLPASSELQKATENSKNLSQASSAQADTVSGEENDVELQEAVAKVESFLKVQNRDLAFSVDENTSRSVVTVKDSTSGEVIRQIPSEEVLKLAERIQDLQQDVGDSVGVFINNQV